MGEVGGGAALEAIFSLGGVCVAEVGGWAALAGASSFVPSMVAVGITVFFLESTENCAWGAVAMARPSEIIL